MGQVWSDLVGLQAEFRRSPHLNGPLSESFGESPAASMESQTMVIERGSERMFRSQFGTQYRISATSPIATGTALEKF